MARIFIVHTSLHWTHRWVGGISLYLSAVKHLICLYNRMPKTFSRITPLELLTRSKSEYRYLLCCHVWGCPIFVLEKMLQNDQKLPKWNWRACFGLFLGFAYEHSVLVDNMQHLITGHISPQFDLVFDYLFDSFIRQEDNNSTIEDICSDIFDINLDWYAEEEFYDAVSLVYRTPPLHDVWIDARGDHNWKYDL